MLYILSAVLFILLFNAFSYDVKGVPWLDTILCLSRSFLAGIGAWWLLHQIF